jgi:carbamoyl-phosphate synthase large subunit
MKILITGAGGDIAQAMTRTLRTHYSEVKIIGCDLNEQPFASLNFDSFYSSLQVNDPLYLSTIMEICTKEEIDLIIPVPELEIEFFSRERLNLPIRVLIANRVAIDVGLDKLITSNFVHGLGDFAPLTSSEFLGSGLNLPVLVKPRSGHGSKNVFICQTMVDVEYHQRNPNPTIFQEILKPSDMEVTCGIYATKERRVFSIQLLRHLSGGRTSWARVIVNEQVTKLCEKIALGLNLQGAINVQLILTDSGPKVFEINPRYSSTVEMRHKLGFMDLVWGIEELLFQRPVVYVPCDPGTLVGRFDEVVVIDKGIIK